MSVVDTLSSTSTPLARHADLRSEDARGLTICDGAGGILALRRVIPELLWLASACRTLLSGRRLSGGDLLKVTAGDDVYLVSHRPTPDGEPAIQIASLYRPEERVVMPYHLAQLVAGLIEEMFAA